MHPWAIALAVVLILVILWDAFETIILSRRVSRKFRLTRLFYRLLPKLRRRHRPDEHFPLAHPAPYEAMPGDIAEGEVDVITENPADAQPDDQSPAPLDVEDLDVEESVAEPEDAGNPGQ